MRGGIDLQTGYFLMETWAYSTIIVFDLVVCFVELHGGTNELEWGY